MDSLKRMVVFAHVVETGSFSAAARRLCIARSAVSRHVSLLEKNAGVRLLNRTTRSLSLTEAGEIYYRSCARIVSEAEAASSRIRRLRDEPTGTLKVAGPTSFGPQLAGLICEFMQQYPALKVELQLGDQLVNLVEEGLDVSIRIGWLQDSGLVARKLCDSPRVLCASPGYLEKRGRPDTPSGLSEHDCVIFTLLPTPHQWRFQRNRHSETVYVNGRTRTNNAMAVRAFVLNGAGIAPLSRFLVADDIRAGQIEQVLPEYDCGSAGVYAVYQDRHYKQARLQLFIDYIAGRMKSLL